MEIKGEAMFFDRWTDYRMLLMMTYRALSGGEEAKRYEIAAEVEFYT